MDQLNLDDDDLMRERPPQDAGFDSFLFEDPSFIEDELQNISQEPDVCQPSGHIIMVSYHDCK